MLGSYKYGYNGKERQEELNLNWIDYGARNYDAALGRWMNIDPLAEDYFDNSPYNYVANTPLIAYDPDGKRIAIVGDKDYRQQVLAKLISLALASETGAAQLNATIKSDNTLTFFDPESDFDNLNMSDADKNGNRSVGFSIDKENKSLDAENGRNGKELASNSNTKIGHELAHFNNDYEGILIQNGRQMRNPFDASEVQAVEVENQIRKELGMYERTHYGGVNVYGMSTKQTQYAGYYELTRKSSYAQIAKDNVNRSQIIKGKGFKISTQGVGTYSYRHRRLLPFVKKPVPNEETSIEKTN
ncbi:RHS repeat-associated core domain-containing protein [uncultured Marixanthomonas sp.]|uniref:RHS repeat-associated core domain-containing protein n=1 Tax=uncultured Marixanthomonas sp. TaxID=757245 RepID=UPI0030DB78B2|tara:strand:- start:291923 stop:292825 length:903 start_codon:yes stop_codon:yes gene_type:complete